MSRLYCSCRQRGYVPDLLPVFGAGCLAAAAAANTALCYVHTHCCHWLYWWCCPCSSTATLSRPIANSWRSKATQRLFCLNRRALRSASTLCMLALTSCPFCFMLLAFLMRQRRRNTCVSCAAPGAYTPGVCVDGGCEWNVWNCCLLAFTAPIESAPMAKVIQGRGGEGSLK